MQTLEIFPVKNNSFNDQYTKLLIIHIFSATKLFLTESLDQCRNNPNNPQNITSEIKAALKNMALEQEFYAQVVMIRQKESDNKKEKEKTKWYNFQGKPARSRRWSDLDHEWSEEKCRTHFLSQR